MAKPSTTGWQEKALVAATREELILRLRKCQLVVQGNIRRRLNVGNASGKHPSKEGESPRKVTARLQRSIVTGEIRTEGDVLIAPIGSNDNIGKVRRLELGFKGVDAAGRNINQGPRPYLRPGLADSLATCAKLLGARRR
jgi:hypothetical protein